METQTRNKKKGFVLGIIGVTCVGALAVGMTTANLSKTISSAPDQHSVTAEGVSFDFTMKGTLDLPLVLIDPNSQGTGGASMTNSAQNVGSIPSNFSYSVSPETLAGIDLANPWFEEARIQVTAIHNGPQLDPEFPQAGYEFNKTLFVWEGTVKDFLTTGFASDESIAPGETVTMGVAVLNPTAESWSHQEVAAAIDETFGTTFTFNQISGGTSPLADYAGANGTKIVTAGEETSGVSWTLPASAIGGIVL